MAKKLLFLRAILLAAALSSVRAGLSVETAAAVMNVARAIVATGIWVDVGKVPAGFDPAFAQALRGWNIVKGGSAAACSLVVRPSDKYVVAIGFFDPADNARVRPKENVVIDGRKVDTLDPAGPRPFVRLYEVAATSTAMGIFRSRDSHVKDEGGATGQMNIVWACLRVNAKGRSTRRNSPGAAILSHRCAGLTPLLGGPRPREEHVNYPKLAELHQRRMLPLRPVALGTAPPGRNRSIRCILRFAGELRDRIRTVLDRWGYAGRDQRGVAGFLSDSGFEVAGRSLETLCLLSRLMKVDLETQVPFEALLARQERKGLHGRGTSRAAKARTPRVLLGTGGDPPGHDGLLRA